MARRLHNDGVAVQTGLTAQQLEQRRGKVMASDVSAYVGRNAYKGALEAWAHNLGIAADDPNAHKGMGLRLEPALIEEAMDRLGVTECEKPGTLFHPVKAWAGCTPDALFPELGEGIQVKNHGLHQAQHFEGKSDEYPDLDWHNDLIPEWHLIQCQWEMWVTGHASWWLGAYFGGSDFRLYHLRYDDDLVQALVSICEPFWREHLDPDGPQRAPEAGGSESASRYLRRAFPRVERPELLPASPEHLELAARYQEANAKAKEWGEAKERAKNMLIQAVGDTEGIEGVCTYKQRNMSPKVDWEAVARDIYVALGGSHSLTIAQFAETHTTTPAPSRTFRLTFKPE